LKKSEGSGHPCFVPNFKGNAFSFFPFGTMLLIGVLDIAFIMSRMVLLFLGFYREEMFNFEEPFSAFVEMIM
jgi:hypothetical protein